MWQFLQGWAGLTVLISLMISVVGVVLAFLTIIWMSEDHFIQPEKEHCRAPLSPGRTLWVCFRNLLGLTILLLGIAMIIAPGPGLLSMLLGVSLMDIPGKHRLLQQGLKLKSVRGSLNWIRRKFGRTPLKFPRRQPRKNPTVENATHDNNA